MKIVATVAFVPRNAHLEGAMVDTPDFDRLANELLIDLAGAQPSDNHVSRCAARLRALWNARGAADIVKVGAELSVTIGPAAAPYALHLDRAIRSLDR